MHFETESYAQMNQKRLGIGWGNPLLLVLLLLVMITGCQRADTAPSRTGAGEEERKDTMYGYADKDENTEVTIPPIDAEIPATLKTATFAMG
mgnify:CR=1 FL=1